MPEHVALPNGHNSFAPDELLAEFDRYGGGLAKLETCAGRPLQILQLSGGGQNGAFGAGFLYGWSESGRRPQFDLVTGISTGALQATFAFLGTKQDDDTLKAIYTDVTRSDIYGRRCPLSVVFGGRSLMRSEPLRRLIDEHGTPELLERVAAQADKGRILIVGTTNLDFNQLWVWNLTAIAQEGGDQGLERYRKVLLAAASPPVLFPPVEIEGYLFVDGSVRDNLLVAGQIGPNRYHAIIGQGGDMYVLFNGRLDTEATAISVDIKNIIRTTLSNTMNAQMADTLVRSYAVTSIQGYRFNLVQISPDYELGEDTMAFDQDEMAALFDMGRNLARWSDSWLHAPLPTEQVPAWLIEQAGRQGAE